jgi:hypothetical protein
MGAVTTPQHRADLFLDRADDPREAGRTPTGERSTLIEFLRWQRLTLPVKCDGLDAEQLARRSVEPSMMSLLGLVRHMAHVERVWFRIRFAGQDGAVAGRGRRVGAVARGGGVRRAVRPRPRP